MRDENTGVNLGGASGTAGVDGAGGASGPERAARPGSARKPETFNGGAPMAPEHSDENPGLGLAAKWGAQALCELKGLGKRIFVHAVALACAVAAAVSTNSVSAGVCVYVGGVCLAARGMAPTPEWAIPTGAGLLQAVLLTLFGFPLPQAIFWGGVQTWGQRLVAKRFQLGGEWVMLLFILPTAIHLFDGTPFLLLAGSFAGVAVIGVLLAKAVAGRKAALAHAEELQKQGPPEPAKIVAYRASLADFRQKVAYLPQSVRPVGESLVSGTEHILECMATDQRDLEPGHRFLNRYFKAAHSVVDKHIALAREKVITPDIADALAKSEEMLARLDGVFAKEHERLLQNDVTDFSADLAVIDTLLKMDGK